MQKTTFTYLNLKQNKGQLVLLKQLFGNIWANSTYLSTIYLSTIDIYYPSIFDIEEAELTNFGRNLTLRFAW